MKNAKKLLALLVSSVAFLTTTAQANTVYTWHGNEDVAPFGLSMQIDLTDAAIASGEFKFDSRYSQDGVLGFFYTQPNAKIPVSLDDNFSRLATNVTLDLFFTEDGKLSGGMIDAMNMENSITMEGDNGMFTVTHANSDAGMTASGCSHWADCPGATGSFDTWTYTVPEPGSLALIGLGVVGMGAFKRRKA